jgi:hypothetical protein
MELKIFGRLFHEKLLLASMKLVTNSKILLVTLSRLYSGDFDPENAYRKPPVILKIVPEAGKFRILRSSWNINSDAGFGTKFRISK